MTRRALYECRITHARTGPAAQRVHATARYLWLVDLDHLPRVPGRWPASAPATTSATRGASIRENLDRFLAARGVDLRGGRVTMLAHARVLGYVFNPLTVYWCHRPDGTLACVVAEVHNTYRQRHAYLLHTDDRGRAEVPKEFYVSPFYPVDGHYRMSLPEPDDRPGAERARWTARTGTRSPPACTAGASRPPRGRCSAPPLDTPGPRRPSPPGSAGRACSCTCAGCR